VRVGNVGGIGHYPWFLDCRLGVRQLASADRSDERLREEQKAFAVGSDCSGVRGRRRVVSEHGAPGRKRGMSRRPRVTTPVSRRRSRRTTCSAGSTAATSAIPRVSATTRSSCWSHTWACDRGGAAAVGLPQLAPRADLLARQGVPRRQDAADCRCRGRVQHLPVPRPTTGEPPGVSAAVPVLAITTSNRSPAASDTRDREEIGQ
jgi:hypothetical protein